jgi:hypothetical protein
MAPVQYTVGGTGGVQTVWVNWVTDQTGATTGSVYIDPWPQWCAQTTASTNVTYDIGGVWQTWCDTSATTTGTSNVTGQVWNFWCDQTSQTGGSISIPMQVTPETVEAREARIERERKAKEEREAIKEKATALLLSILSHEQRAEYEKDGHFHVHTADGLRSYRLKPGSSVRQVRSPDGQERTFCIHPDLAYPPEDVTAAQLLMLETDEEAFLRTANARTVLPQYRVT